MSNDVPGTIIAVGVGSALPENREKTGVIMEVHGGDSARKVEQRLERMLVEAFKLEARSGSKAFRSSVSTAWSGLAAPWRPSRPAIRGGCLRAAMIRILQLGADQATKRGVFNDASQIRLSMPDSPGSRRPSVNRPR
jgi:hypothetical protein